MGFGGSDGVGYLGGWGSLGVVPEVHNEHLPGFGGVFGGPVRSLGSLGRVAVGFGGSHVVGVFGGGPRGPRPTSPSFWGVSERLWRVREAPYGVLPPGIGLERLSMGDSLWDFAPWGRVGEAPYGILPPGVRDFALWG